MTIPRHVFDIYDNCFHFYMLYGSSKSHNCIRICLLIYTYTYIQIQMYIKAYWYGLHGFTRHYCVSVSSYTSTWVDIQERAQQVVTHMCIYQWVWVCAKNKAQNAFLGKKAHPLSDSNPQPPYYISSIHMYINTCIDISSWVSVTLLPKFVLIYTCIWTDMPDRPQKVNI